MLKGGSALNYLRHAFLKLQFRYLWYMTEKTIIELLNQLFEIEKKTQQHGFDRIDRNIDRLKWLLDQAGYTYKDPTGEAYDETRTDCQATILSEANPQIIHDTVKPIIYQTVDGTTAIIQQARVIIN